MAADHHRRSRCSPPCLAAGAVYGRPCVAGGPGCGEQLVLYMGTACLLPRRHWHTFTCVVCWCNHQPYPVVMSDGLLPHA